LRTIVALATPPGIGGIAVIRISGNNAISIADAVFQGKSKIIDAQSHTIHFGKLIHNGNIIDTVIASVFISPESYTGEDVVEISCHGGHLIAKQIIEAMIQNGAEYAAPGEFTKRAFLNGKLDLSQVEAVADLIHSSSIPATQTAARQLTAGFSRRLNIILDELLSIAGLLELELDFAEEDLEFAERKEIETRIDAVILFCNDLKSSHHSAEILRNGYFVGIAGYPNSGKSTLFNTLLQKHRAIVSPIPGTTRDYLEETIFIDDIPIRIIDTAGIRETDDIVEHEGVKFVDSILEQSDMILIINDISLGKNNSDALANEIKKKYNDKEILILQNKIDLANSNQVEDGISAKNNIGIDRLKELIGERAINSLVRDSDILVNQRQSILLTKAAELLNNAKCSLNRNAMAEELALDIREAARTLGEITGKSFNEKVLEQVFSKFCIGK